MRWLPHLLFLYDFKYCAFKESKQWKRNQVILSTGKRNTENRFYSALLQPDESGHCESRQSQHFTQIWRVPSSSMYGGCACVCSRKGTFAFMYTWPNVASMKPTSGPREPGFYPHTLTQSWWRGYVTFFLFRKLHDNHWKNSYVLTCDENNAIK